MSDLASVPSSATQGLLDALEEPAALIRDCGEIYAVNRPWRRPMAGLAAPGIGLGRGESIPFDDPEAGAELGKLVKRAAQGTREEEITDIAIGPGNARIWFEMRLRRLPDMALILLTYRDISRRVHAEEQLRMSRSRLRSVIAGAPIVLLGLDNAGIFHLVEGVGASGLGATPELLIGRSVFEVYAHLPPLLNAVRGALTGETLAVSVSVGRLNYELRFSPTIDRQGLVRGIVGVATDITERTRIQEMKNEFVSVVSHELRTPLTSIRGSLGLLEGGVAGALPEQAQELVRIARTNSERLIRLINDVLDLDKLEAGRLEFQNSPVVPKPMLVRVAEDLKEVAAENDIALRVDALGSLPPVLGDAERLLQVVFNLTSNALKFAPKKSVVELRASLTEEKRIRFEVVDQGPGISSSQRDRLFAKFQQLDKLSARHSGGSGLGLAISKAIVAAHRGVLDVESEEGHGSTFFFELPAIGASGAAAPPDTSRARRNRTVEIDVGHIQSHVPRTLGEQLLEFGESLATAFKDPERENMADLYRMACEFLSSTAPDNEPLRLALEDLVGELKDLDPRESKAQDERSPREQAIESALVRAVQAAN